MWKFEIYTDKAWESRFRLKAGNGEIILASEWYSSKAGCENGIASVIKNWSDESNFEKTTTPSWKFRFNLKAWNGQIIGTSQNYSSESWRDNWIGSVWRSSQDAKIVEV